MVKRSDYNPADVDICLSVMVELLTILGEFRENIVLVGGWVPYFIINDIEPDAAHTGSMDIDLALDFKNITDDSYRTILKHLTQRGYEQDKEQPFIFYRHIENLIVEIDLLSGEYGGTGKTRRTQKVQDVKARKARACDLVFDNNIKIELTHQMPDGSENTQQIKVASEVSFIITKGMALWTRMKEKDAYDISFILRNYPGGIEKLAERFRPFLSNKLVKEGLEKICSKYESPNAIGPAWTAEFEEIDDKEEV